MTFSLEPCAQNYSAEGQRSPMTKNPPIVTSKYTVQNSSNDSKTEQVFQPTVQNSRLASREALPRIPVYTYLPTIAGTPLFSFFVPHQVECEIPSPPTNPPLKRGNPDSTDQNSRKSAFQKIKKTPEHKKTETSQVLRSSSPPSSLEWESLLKKGGLYLKDQRYKESIQILRQSFEIFRTKVSEKDKDAYELFRTFFITSCYLFITAPQSMESIGKELKKDPQDIDWLFLKGLFHIKPTKYQQSIKAFQNLLDQNPKDQLAQLLKEGVELFLEREKVQLPSQKH